MFPKFNRCFATPGRLLNRKVFIKLSKPEPLRTKVKNSKKWSFNDFLGFPTPYTNIVL